MLLQLRSDSDVVAIVSPSLIVLSLICLDLMTWRYCPVSAVCVCEIGIVLSPFCLYLCYCFCLYASTPVMLFCHSYWLPLVYVSHNLLPSFNFLFGKYIPKKLQRTDFHMCKIKWLCPYTAERRDVLRNTSPKETEIPLGQGFFTLRPKRSKFQVKRCLFLNIWSIW